MQLVKGMGKTNREDLRRTLEAGWGVGDKNIRD